MEFYQINSSEELITQASMWKAFNLDLTQRMVIAFVGAGGKTTSIYQLANELASLGKRVIITTTTHMFLPITYGVLKEDKEMLLRMLDLSGVAVAGIPCGDGKMTKVSDSFYEWMTTVSDYILVEADGSKRLPIKVPGKHEPVLPKNTDLVIILAGLTCLSRPIMECCHRWNLATEILDCQPAHKISEQDAARLIEAGYCKQLNIPFKILLNQCDNSELQKKAIEIIYNLKLQGIAAENIAACNFISTLAVDRL